MAVKTLEWTDRVWDMTHFRKENLLKPLRWRKSGSAYVRLYSDIANCPDEFVDRLFAVMAITPNIDYYLVTRSPADFRGYLSLSDFYARIIKAFYELDILVGPLNKNALDWMKSNDSSNFWPMQNIKIGVAFSNQIEADTRIPTLLRYDVSFRFLLCDPLEDQLSLEPYLKEGIHWVIVAGGEKPVHPRWVRSLRDQCLDANIPFFFCGWGKYLPVPVQDNDSVYGGRAYECPLYGGVRAILIRDSGRNKPARLMNVNDHTRTGKLLDRDTMAVDFNGKPTGRLLDGCEYVEFPK